MTPTEKVFRVPAGVADRYDLAGDGIAPGQTATYLARVLVRGGAVGFVYLTPGLQVVGAPEHSYKTREASAVPWDQVPLNNRRLMIAVAAEVSAKLREDELERLGRALLFYDQRKGLDG